MIEIKLMKCGMSESSGSRSLSYDYTTSRWSPRRLKAKCKGWIQLWIWSRNSSLV